MLERSQERNKNKTILYVNNFSEEKQKFFDYFESDKEDEDFQTYYDRIEESK